jgi:hypothetical protein
VKSSPKSVPLSSLAVLLPLLLSEKKRPYHHRCAVFPPVLSEFPGGYSVYHFLFERRIVHGGFEHADFFRFAAGVYPNPVYDVSRSQGPGTQGPVIGVPQFRLVTDDCMEQGILVTASVFHFRPSDLSDYLFSAKGIPQLCYLSCAYRIEPASAGVIAPWRFASAAADVYGVSRVLRADRGNKKGQEQKKRGCIFSQKRHKDIPLIIVFPCISFYRFNDSTLFIFSVSSVSLW